MNDIAWQYNLPPEKRISSLYGAAITKVLEMVDGRMYVHNGEYMSQVNFCPFTGRKARTPIDGPE